MKKYILFLLAVVYTITSVGQLKRTVSCPTFEVDILDGKVNELSPTATVGEIKGKFPCFTSTEEEGSSNRCGSNVLFKDKGINFYSGRDYIEINPGFKGKLSLPLIGAKRTSLFKWLGHPKIKEVSWDAFQMAYGTLILYYKAGKVYKIQFSNLSTEALTLCE